MSEFEKQKEAELRRIQEVKADEARKLRRERKVFEEHQRNLLNKPNKKERDEIEASHEALADAMSRIREFRDFGALPGRVTLTSVDPAWRMADDAVIGPAGRRGPRSIVSTSPSDSV